MNTLELDPTESELLKEYLEKFECAFELGETQGICLGVICGAKQKDLAFWQYHVEKELAGNASYDEQFSKLIQNLLKTCVRGLSHEAFELKLLLPAEEVSLSTRTQALTKWCRGFLYGLALVKPPSYFWENETVKEAIQDISQITELDFEHAEPTEENEVAYTELVEYLKIATLLIFEHANEQLQLEGQSFHGLH